MAFNFGATTSQSFTGFGGAAPQANPPGHSSAGTLFGTGASLNTTANQSFGANPTTSAPNPAGAAGGGFSFGNNSTQTAPAAGGFSFGNNSTPAPAAGGGFSFGNNSTPAPAAGGFSFGNNSTPISTPASAAAGGFSFGAPAATNSTSTFNFGANNNNNTTTATSAPGSFSFGNTATNTSGVGAGAGAGIGSFSFGANNTTAPTTGGFSFGAKPQQQTTSFFGQPQQQQQQQAVTAPQPEKTWEELAIIRAKWDPSSPLCGFKHYFYNQVPPNEIRFYVRPPNQDEKLWDEAIRNNPDPSCMVPVLVVGFDDLLKRINIQNEQTTLHREKVQEAQERLAMAEHQLVLNTKVKMQAHWRRSMDLTKRLLRLMRYSQVLRFSGTPLYKTEETLQKQMEKLSSKTDGVEHMQAKINMLSFKLQAIKRERESREASNNEVWKSADEGGALNIAKILETMQQEMKTVIDILQKDCDDIEAVEAGLKIPSHSKGIEW
ncbi:nucleoporin complex subunit 54-domain-containing protein [Phycomyces blakesleeanus]|uniref:Nucleoporin complex subunit 54-domain-containing protein n=1 Tax=Phycomyces blakesleeanus TaxID=4837 RepID=A0ABR3AJ16_PHYBL